MFDYNLQSVGFEILPLVWMNIYSTEDTRYANRVISLNYTYFIIVYVDFTLKLLILFTLYCFLFCFFPSSVPIHLPHKVSAAHIFHFNLSLISGTMKNANREWERRPLMKRVKSHNANDNTQ